MKFIHLFKYLILALFLISGIGSSPSANAYGGLINNGDFESGSSGWGQYYYINSQLSAANLISTGHSGTKGYYSGSLYGSNSGESVLASSLFNIPSSANSVTVTYESLFYKGYASCLSGVNEVYVNLYDSSTSEALTTAIIYDANTAADVYSISTRDASLGVDLTSRSGHYYYLIFSTITSDPLCSHLTYLDNISVNPGSSVYRLANWKTHERLFTTDWSEVQSIKDHNGWVHEGTSFYAASMGTAVYRLANWKTHERLFTTDWNEVTSINNTNGWVYENLAFYAQGSGTPVYRMANWKTHERLFTTDYNEVVGIMNKNGWVYENLAFYTY